LVARRRQRTPECRFRGGAVAGPQAAQDDTLAALNFGH
jgi:hypothetical protein